MRTAQVKIVERGQINPTIMLIHAHDSVWNNKTIPLEERVASCDILWKLVIVSRARFDRSDTELLESIFAGYDALRSRGWREINSAPPEKYIEIIEAGSTGIHRGYRDQFGFWVVDSLDTWPCQSPILWREIPS